MISKGFIPDSVQFRLRQDADESPQSISSGASIDVYEKTMALLGLPISNHGASSGMICSCLQKPSMNVELGKTTHNWVFTHFY